MKRLGRLFLVVLLLFVLVGVGFWFWLGSAGGQAFLRDQVVKATKDALAGRLEFEGADFVDGHLVLTKLELYTPEGELVLSIARAELDVDVRAAAQGRYRLSHVRLDKVHAELVQDERGLNLVRALASKQPPKPGPSAPLDLSLDDVELVDSDARYTTDGKTVRLEQLHATGHAVIKTQALSVDSSLDLTAVATDPVPGPVTLVASTTSPTPGTLRVESNLHFADEVVKGSFVWPQTSATVEEVRVTPALVKALTGSDALRLPVVLHGTASTSGATLAAQGGRGRLSLDGKWDLEARTVSAFALRAEDVDLSEWLAGGKASRVDLDLRGAATSLTLEKLTGHVEGSGTWKTPSGSRLADLELNVDAKDGRAQVKRVHAMVPGATLDLHGSAGLSKLDLEGALEAKDLSRLPRVVQEFTGVTLPPLAGNGALALTVKGPTRSPQVTAKGELVDLRYDRLAARRLALDVTVPDVTKPLDTDGTIEATSLTVGSQTLDSVKGSVATRGRDFDLSLTTRGLGDLALEAQGRLDDDSNGLALGTLQLSTGTDRWTLDAPTRVSWHRQLELQPTALTSGSQHLSVSGSLAGKTVSAHARAVDVELAKLPQVVVPADWGLGGVVTLEGTADGVLPRPDLTVKASARDASVRGITGIGAQLEGRLLAGRATGTLRGTTSLGGLDARFDVPVDAVLKKKSDGLEIDVEAKAIDTEAIQRWWANRVPPVPLAKRFRKRPLEEVPVSAPPFTGLFDAQLSLKGPANDPALTVTTTSASSTVSWGAPLKQLTFAATTMTVATDEHGALGATLRTSALGATTSLTLHTPLSLPSLRERLPAVEELRQLQLTVDGTIEQLELEQLRPLGVPGIEDVSGKTSLTLTARGSVDDPRGLLTLRYEKVTAPPLEALDGHFELTAAEGLTRLAGKGRMQGKPLYELDAVVDTSLASLQHLDRLGPEHVTTHLSIAPMPLARLLPKRDDEVQASGTVSLDLEVKGTLDDPKLVIDSTVQNLSFGKVPLGQARLVSRTQGKAQTIGLALKASGASELRATGTVGLDPSIETLRRGLEWTALPIDVSVTSRAFELGFLSGVHPMVRTVGGELTVQNFKVSGLLGNPDVAGEVAWKKGRLALASFGDYRDIDLETKVTRERIEVERLSVRAGSGGFAIDPTVAVRQATGIWTLTSSGSATRFPIVTDDQLLAIVNVKYALEGEVSETELDLTRLSLARVDVELPEVKRRNVQNLERPSDVVITRQGRVVAGKKKVEVAKTSSGRAYRANIDAPRNIWVRSSDVNLELGLSEGFRVEYVDSTQLFGEAQVLGGRIDVIGREFKVSRTNTGSERAESTVRFAGPAKQPYVNVTAFHTNDREKVKVTVNVVGRGTDVQIKVSSDPAMIESDIYALLATGRRDLRRSSGASITADQAVSVVGSYAANQLKNALIKRLPIDLFDTISVETGAEGLESTRVEVGKYLSDSLYLGYTFQPGANETRGESQHTGRLEYQVSKSVSLEVTAGSAASVGADLVFSREY